MYVLFPCSFPLWFTIGYWIYFQVLNSRTLLFIHLRYDSLYLLLPNSQYFPHSSQSEGFVWGASENIFLEEKLSLEKARAHPWKQVDLWSYGIALCPWRDTEHASSSSSLSHSVMSDSLQPARLLCPWDSPGKDTGVGCHALLQGIFPTQDPTQASSFVGRLFTIWATGEV